MPTIPLTSGAYSSQGYIANAQRAINLFSEINPKETTPIQPVTQYPRPGLNLLSAPPVIGTGRCLFTSSKGQLFACINQNIYYIDPNWTFTLLGALLTSQNTPVSMADNGSNVIIVDGDISANNIDITVSPPTMTIIGDPNFVGATRADFLDYFLILNQPNTNKWYSTLSNQLIFNALYIGQKTAWPDDIQCVIAIERQALILGKKKSEVWFNAGAVPFPFQIVPGVIIEQGCVAVYSAAKMDTNAYWLSESPEGDRMVMRCDNRNVAQRISTHAIENEIKKYVRVDDAIGSVFQVNGHSFYSLHFPTADVTWTFDEATKQWSQWAWIDTNGNLHRSRDTFHAYAYGKTLALDWANGNLYEVRPDAVTDNGVPIVWIRSFPHVVAELKYINQASFVADVQTGTLPGSGEVTQFLSPWSLGFSSGFGPLTAVPAPVINLRVSRDGGVTFGNNRPKQRISAGFYRSMMRWRANGLARDAVFEVSSTAEMSGALQGAYIDPIVATS